MSNKNINKKVEQHYKKKRGSKLSHGQAHVKEHKEWGRRDFLKMTGLAALGGSFMLGSTPMQAFSPNKMLNALNMSECGDRILVLVRLKGGNDGLNTIVPRSNDEYYNIRPTLAVQQADMWNLDTDFGMANYMNALEPFWNEGRMKVIHNVGYPEANYSHFRSSDIWASASDSDAIEQTGWIGRWLDYEYPAFTAVPPTIPPALQIGVQTNMVFSAMAGPMSLSISNPAEFYQLAQSGELYDTSQLNLNIPDESELSYVRSIANSAFRYSETIRDAYNASQTQADYSGGDYLGNQLQIVSRLIKGNLGTKVYMVTLDGFDTHAGQVDAHPTLLSWVANSISAFYEDLGASGHSGNVLTMTFSEFGRTIFENGSAGTDHGTGAPMMVFGDEIGGGFAGTAPDLINVDQYGDPFFSTDFRTAYSTVLQDWMCVPEEVVQNTLFNENFGTIDGLLPGGSPSIGANGRAVLLGHQPNTQAGSIDMKYAVESRGNVRLQILTLAGSAIRTLVNEFKEKGSYTLTFSPAGQSLPSGEYLYRLDAGGKSYVRPIRW